MLIPAANLKVSFFNSHVRLLTGLILAYCHLSTFLGDACMKTKEICVGFQLMKHFSFIPVYITFSGNVSGMQPKVCAFHFWYCQIIFQLLLLERK
jgi:heme/copper-type cytochrome/quinol oxidase subunit 4